MIAEVLCIGTELLLGDITNTNAAYISKNLAALGIDCYYHTVVGDNKPRIKKFLETALNRSDILIITGGLGPTDDDITIQCLAEFFGKELIIDEASLKEIEGFFKKLDREMPSSNIKQALRPRDAKVMPNLLGTAPGIIWEIPDYKGKKRIILVFPGVPYELKGMWEGSAERYLRQYSHDVLISRNLKYIGISEAALGEKIKDLTDSSNPTIAPYVGRGEIRLKITAKAQNADKANLFIDEMEKEVLSRTKEYFYGYDDETLEEIVGKLLKEKNLSLAVAESCTGGLVSSRLTDVSGSSSYIKENMVTYSNEAKTRALGISAKLIESYGAVSDKTAMSMAEGARATAQCDVGIGITGIAGPTGGTPQKPVGLVYVGICDKHNLEVHELRIPEHLKRREIKYRASQYALNYLRLFLTKTKFV